MGFKIGAHRLDELDHILRDGRVPLILIAVVGVLLAQLGGVQRVGVYFTQRGY